VPEATTTATRPQASGGPAPRTSGRRLRWLGVAARKLRDGLALTGAALLVFHAGFGLSEITSGSMGPTLQGEAGLPDNDWILYETVTTRFAAPPRQGLVVFDSKEGVRIAKRVVGFPGEALTAKDGRLVVDGAALPPPPDVEGYRVVPAGHLRPRPKQPTYTVPEASVFVLGDDQGDSWDSRFFGGLPEARFRGRVVAVVWPPARWRWHW
jgi:signal peptidase I